MIDRVQLVIYRILSAVCPTQVKQSVMLVKELVDTSDDFSMSMVKLTIGFA